MECQLIVNIFSRRISPYERFFIQTSMCGSAVEEKSLVCCARLIQTENRDLGGVSLLRPPQCGRDISDRISNGQANELNEFPWMALIKYRKSEGEFGFHCGGSLINSRYIVTAAHCTKLIPNDWQVVGVRLGEYDLSNDGQDCNEGVCADVPVDVSIDKIIVHKDYDKRVKAQYNDIALIRFDRDVLFSNYIQPICLPVDESERLSNIVGTRAVAAGWGRTKTASSSDIRLKVELDIRYTTQCSNIFRPSGELYATHNCALVERKARTPAKLDESSFLVAWFAKKVEVSYQWYGMLIGPGTHVALTMRNRARLFLLGLLLVALFLEGLAQGENQPCTNPMGETGTCVPFKQCQPLVDIYSKSVVDPEENNFVQSSICRSAAGEKTLVCCAGPIQTEKRGPEGVSLLRPPHCGRELTNRIIRGQATELDEYSWMALLRVTFHDTQLCAGGKNGEDTCTGDSGGPLMKRIKSTYYMFGIVSFGPKNCGNKDFPGIYTNVVKYLDWIESHLE
ncbi:CLIP domain-containing serine protease B4-like [Wyeomyia smithii]|uniref:CLIP domain-containing serine protease B4-like n=1 Tax=Wyeomyia smithii TaxID=174621 RepID=UPI002467CBD2|nr:CLIP domain-containing serine protease B4-like [Wyeomyia smithii]